MTNYKIDLSGQVALVTGGGRGLGRGFALALANVSAAVAVTSRTEPEIRETARLIEAEGGRALPIVADVSNPDAVRELVTTTERELGPIDLLINNAGLARAPGLVVDVEEDVWWREVEVNLRGPFLCMKAVLPGMIARGRGRIINLVSNGGLKPAPRASAYGTSKAALTRLSETVAQETLERGISVFAIEPGTVPTPMNEWLRDAEIVGLRAPGIRERFRQLYSSGGFTPIERSVELVLFLASGQGDMLSGRVIGVREDDPARMVREIEEIRRGDLYTMRLLRPA